MGVLLRTVGRSEDAVLVAIESQRLAPFPQIRSGRMEVVERVLGAGKAQMKQLAGRIVDEDEQGAFGATVLEPPMVRAVDLHQLTQAVALPVRLMQPPLPLTA